MTVKKLASELEKLNIQWHENTDCSEIAYDVKQALGIGRIMTIVLVDKYGKLVPFNSEWLDGSTREYMYHTFVIAKVQGKKYIIDVTSAHKMFSVALFRKMLVESNEDNIKRYTFLYRYGDKLNDIVYETKISRLSGFKPF